MNRPALALLLMFPAAAFAQDAEPEAEAEAGAEEAVEEEAPAAAPVTYNLASSTGALTVLVKYDRNSLLARMGHDHVVTPTSFTGTVTWSNDDLSACNVNISFPVSALVVDPAGTRAAAGLSGETSDGDKKKITSNLLGKNQLNANSFSNITFQSTSCSGSGTQATVAGNLSIRGASKAVSASMNISADGSSFTASGSFDAAHSDFGFDPFTALAGSLKNANPLHFKVNVTGSAQ